jgi:putative ABC transport system ATP-binding protein
VRALDGVSIEVGAGEFVAVRGASGSGKSTLLLAIGGMIRPSAGVVELEGRDLYAMSGRQRARIRAERVGFVFQMFHLVPYLTALENVLINTLAGAAVTRADAVSALEDLEMGDRLTHRPSQLSAGERQRVALARALIKRPDILLADEPTGNLDPENSRQVMSHFAQFHEAGGAVIIVTHEPIVEEYAQRTLRLTAGRLSGE